MTGPLTVLFDVDGTLVDSEQHGHRVAFNEAFSNAGLPDRWDEATYVELLAVTGGERRLAAWFNRHGKPQTTSEADFISDLCRQLHKEKTYLFVEMCENSLVPARAGAERLIAELIGGDARLAITTTGSRSWVEPLVTNLFGEDVFEFMVTGDDVANTKPDPEVYLRALEHPKTERRNVVAIEDSMPGLAAAVAAHVPTVLVMNTETGSGDSSAAALVLTGYGDLQGDVVVSDPGSLCPAGTLTAAVVAAVARNYSSAE